MEIIIRKISADESDKAYDLTRELMEYHKALDIFTMTPERFKELVKNEKIMSFLAIADGETAGLMNAFFKYTTFSGRKIFYIEDLYARERYRGHGIGGKLFQMAKEIAAENDCEQIELKCACWNTNSAKFYKAHGMQAEADWNVFTLDRKFFI